MNNIEARTFAYLLRFYRLKAGFSQAELAARARLSERAISDLERGVRRSPYLPTVHALCEALRLTPEEISEFARSVPRGRGRVPRVELPSGNPVGHLPVTYGAVVGREREMAKLEEMLLSPAFRLVTLTGPPGVGKTRLAVDVSQRLQTAHGLRVEYIRLHGVSEPDQLPVAIASALGLRPYNTAILDLLAARIGSEPFLFLLDNFEHVLEASTYVVALLRRCPGVRFLITSRAPLLVRGEMEFPMAPLAAAPAADDTVDELQKYPAVALFVDRVREHAPDFQITPDNAAAIAAISRRLEGIPLAIEIAAARSALLTPEEVLAGLSEPLEFLTDGPADLPVWHETVQAAIAWSYQLLTASQQRALRWLSLLNSSWTVDDAVDLLAAGETALPGERTAIAADVAALVRHALVLRYEEHGASRLRMLSLVGSFGLAQLRATGEFEPASCRLVDCVRRLVQEVRPHLQAADAEAWTGRLDRSAGAIHSALRHCEDRGYIDIAAEILWTVRFWFETGPVDRVARWIEESLERGINPEDKVAEGRLRILLGFQRSRFLGTAPASPEITRGLALLEAPEHSAARREAIDYLQPFIQEATLPEFQAEADAQVEVLRESTDRLSLGRALMARGRRQMKRGLLEEAEADVRESLAVVGDYVTFRRYAALVLGAIQILSGDLKAARQSILQELEGQRGANIRPVPYSYAVLGRISLRLGERTRAVQEHAEAIQRARTVGSMMAMPMTLDGVACLAAAARRDVVASLLLGAGEMPDYFSYGHSLFDSLREREELIVRLRTQLGFHRFYSAYEEGRRLAPERAIAQAMEELERLR